MRRLLIITLLIASAVHADARRRSGSFMPDLRRVLVIAAHPDDETLLSPLLGPLCSSGRSTCTILVLTNGESGNVRRNEMAAAADAIGARLIHWAWPDVMSGFAEQWPGSVAAVRDVIAKENPTTIITFDPRHGTTCHPAHRETARIGLEADGPSRTLLIETGAILGSDAIRLFNAAPSYALEVDVASTWEWIVNDAALHASQFSQAQIDSLRNMPAELRRVWLAPASRMEGAVYVAECAANVAGAVP